VYRAPDASIAGYDKVILDPVTVWHVPGAGDAVSRADVDRESAHIRVRKGSILLPALSKYYTWAWKDDGSIRRIARGPPEPHDRVPPGLSHYGKTSANRAGITVRTEGVVMTGAWIGRRFTANAADSCARVAIALAVSLVAGPRDASLPGHQPSGTQVAEADRVDDGTRGMWSRLGDLLATVARKDHGADRDRERPPVDRNAEQVGTPFDVDVRALTSPPPGR